MKNVRVKMTLPTIYAMLGCLFWMVLIVLATGCASTRTALPPNLYGEAKVAQMTGIRTRAFEYSPVFQ